MTIEGLVLGRPLTSRASSVKARRAGVTEELRYACHNVLHIYGIRCGVEQSSALQSVTCRFLSLFSFSMGFFQVFAPAAQLLAVSRQQKAAAAASPFGIPSVCLRFYDSSALLSSLMRH